MKWYQFRRDKWILWWSAGRRTLPGIVPGTRPTVAAVLALAVLVFLPLMAVAQTRARAGKVYLSGENPWIFLYDKPDGRALTRVSFWRIHWSPVGSGHVCYVTAGDGKAPGAVRVALYDNRKLFDYLTGEVLGSYDKSYVERPFKAVGGATFAAGGDSITERRETCRSDAYTVELVWRELREAGLHDVLAGSRPTNPFGITWLQIPAGRAEVRINGKSAPGTSVPADSFLAFGETWIK